jgi:hypothetical protein
LERGGCLTSGLSSIGRCFVGRSSIKGVYSAHISGTGH